MPRLNEERDGDYAEYAGTGTGSHYDRLCEDIPGTHPEGLDERLNCNVQIGTGTGTDNTRLENWQELDPLAAFPTSEGWIHLDRERCWGCCYCCKLDNDDPPNVVVTAPCLGLPGTGPESTCELAYDESDGCYKCYLTGTCLARPFALWIKLCCVFEAGTGTTGGWRWKPTIAFTIVGTTEPDTAEYQEPQPDWTSECDNTTLNVNATWLNVVADLCCTNPEDSIQVSITGPAKGQELWWCVKQDVIGDRRICTQDTTSAYDGPYESQVQCENACEEPEFWCVEFTNEDEEGNPTSRPYVECLGLGTGDQIGQIVMGAGRTGIVIGGPWTEDNCTAACPPCGGDYSS